MRNTPQENDMTPEAKDVLTKGFFPLLALNHLEVLEAALRRDDPALIQGCTTKPVPLACVQNWPVEAACMLGYCGWKGDGIKTVSEAEEFFADKCFHADQLLQEPAACRHFLNWYDETPRDQMRRQLLPLVKAEIARRHESVEVA